MENCIFCKIIDGQLGSATIFENQDCKVILDRFPGNEGHVLVISKKHIKNIFEMDPDLGGRLFAVAVKTAKIMKEALGFENMNVVQNNGSIAGQTVHHFHIHLIPRYENDSVSIKWKQLELTDEQIEAVRKKLAESFK